MIDRQFCTVAIEREAALVRPASRVSPASPRLTHSSAPLSLTETHTTAPAFRFKVNRKHRVLFQFFSRAIRGPLLSDGFLSFLLSLLHPSLIPSADLLDHLCLLLPVMSICFISVFISSVSSSYLSLHSFFLSFILFGLLSVRLLNLRVFCCPPHPLTPTPPTPIPCSFFPPPMFPFTDSQHPLSSLLRSVTPL